MGTLKNLKPYRLNLHLTEIKQNLPFFNLTNLPLVETIIQTQARMHIVVTRSIFILSFALLFSTQSYSLSSGSKVSDLRDQLFDETSHNHYSISYKQARRSLLGHMAIIMKNDNYFVKDVYCEADYMSPGLGKIPNNNVINVEHTWPQSKFGGSDRRSQKSDLHHLYPTDSQLNSIRGNYPFGEVVEDTSYTKCPQSHIGYDKNGQRTFEPPAKHKGNVARALFYFSVRYKISISDSEESALRQWHYQDPVDTQELLRNDQVEGYQGNRNPFIDEPHLVGLISNF